MLDPRIGRKWPAWGTILTCHPSPLKNEFRIYGRFEVRGPWQFFLGQLNAEMIEILSKNLCKGAIWEKRPLNSKGPKTHKKLEIIECSAMPKRSKPEILLKIWDIIALFVLGVLHGHESHLFRRFNKNWKLEESEEFRKSGLHMTAPIWHAKKNLTLNGCHHAPRSRFTRVDALSDEDLDFRERELETVPCQIQQVFEGIQRLSFAKLHEEPITKPIFYCNCQLHGSICRAYSSHNFSGL